MQSNNAQKSQRREKCQIGERMRRLCSLEYNGRIAEMRG